MQVYIVKINYDYEGFIIDSTYASENDAMARMAELESHSKLPYEDPAHEFAGDSVEVECLEVIL